MLVEQVDLPVNECAQEVAFTKLDDTVRVLRTWLAQRCADSGTLNAGERRKCSPISRKATYFPRKIQTSRKWSIFTACSGGAGSTRGT